MPVVASFRDLADAEVASASLYASGIANVFEDEQTIGLAWHYSNAIGGVRLRVAAGAAEEARAMLYGPMEVEWPEAPAGSADEECPACGRFALELDSGPRKTLAVMTGLGVPIWFWRSRLRCRSCGFRRKIPVRMRPELLLVWLLTGAAVVAAIAVLLAIVGFVGVMLARVLGFAPDGRIL